MNKLIRTAGVLAGGLTLIGLANPAHAAISPGIGSDVVGVSQEPAGGAANDPDVYFAVPLLDMSCLTATANGEITGGTVPGKIGEITSSSFNNCKGPLDLDMGVDQVGTWNINITGGGPTSWTGNISNVSAHVYDLDTAGGLCEFDVNGTVAGTFNESGQLLAVNGSTLNVDNVNGCFTLIDDSDNATFIADFQLRNPATNAVWPIDIS